jgi:CheY-like chemotaxis protein
LQVLVAEDDAVNRKVAEHMLRQLGYRAEFVADGAAAVQELERRSYDLILMDVQMPEMDGVEATRQIRHRLAADRQPMIVALTASALVGDRERFLAAGMDGYLSKPIQLRDLAEAIDQFCAGRQSHRSAEAARKPVEPLSSEPVDLDLLAHRTGDRLAAQRLVDQSAPVLLGDAVRTVIELRIAVDCADEPSAGSLLRSLSGAAESIAARPLHDAVRLADAAVRAGRWFAAVAAVDDVSTEIDRLRAWYVDRAVDAVSVA